LGWHQNQIASPISTGGMHARSSPGSSSETACAPSNAATKVMSSPAFSKRHWNSPGAPVMPRGESRAAGGLQFVRAQRDLRRQTGPQQHRHGDQSAAARDRIDESRPESGEEKCGINPRVEVHERKEFKNDERMGNAFYSLPCGTRV
jgi:hypothetical protein